MASAVLGGYAEVYISVDSDYVAKASAEETFKFVEITFSITFYGFGLKGNYQHTGFHAKTELSQQFIEATTVLIVSTGGSYFPIVAAGKLAEATFGAWGKTVAWQPAPIYPTYRPLGSLFKDAAKGKVFDAFAQGYVAKANKDREKNNGGEPPLPGQSAAIKSACGDPGGGLYSAAELPDPKPTKEEQGDGEDTGITGHMLAADREREAAWHAAAAGAVPLPGADGNATGGGFAAIGHGVDVVSGLRKFRIMPKVTYDRNRTYYDPNTLRHLTLPDAVGAALQCTTCFKESQVDFVNGSVIVNFEIDKTGFTAALSYDGAKLGHGAFRRLIEQYAQKTANFSIGEWTLTRDVDIYRLLYDGTSKSVLFTNTLKKIPASAGPTDPAWGPVFEKFGTHYTSELGYGATCNITVAFMREGVRGFSTKTVHDNLNIDIENLQKRMGIPNDWAFPWGHHSRKVDPAIEKHVVNRTFSCRGGNTKLLDNKPPYNTSAVNYWKWLLSVPYSPAPIDRSVRLLPNYLLVAGDDPALGAAFKAATEHYISTAPKEGGLRVYDFPRRCGVYGVARGWTHPWCVATGNNYD